jgi:hypothetical protein
MNGKKISKIYKIVQEYFLLEMAELLRSGQNMKKNLKTLLKNILRFL